MVLSSAKVGEGAALGEVSLACLFLSLSLSLGSWWLSSLEFLCRGRNRDENSFEKHTLQPHESTCMLLG